MQNRKYLIIIAVLAALFMGAVGIIVGMTMQQKMNASSGNTEVVPAADAVANQPDEQPVNEVENNEGNDDGAESDGQEESPAARNG